MPAHSRKAARGVYYAPTERAPQCGIANRRREIPGRRGYMTLRFHLPVLAFVAALVLMGFLGGVLVGYKRYFPTQTLLDARKTVMQMTAPSIEFPGRFLAFSDVVPQDSKDRRIEIYADGSIADRVIVQGGRWTFTDLCPGDGCIAVEYGRDGQPVHSYPFRPGEFEASRGVAEPHETPPGFSLPEHSHIGGMAPYPNGDLLATLQSRSAFPYAFGVVRVDRDGQPVWFRNDYSHHWPTITGNSDEALVPALRTNGDLRPYEARLTPEFLERMERCFNGQGPYFDVVNVLDGEGRILREMPVLEALLDSPYASALLHTTNVCDPVHLNFAHQLGPDAGGAEGIAPGDVVVSMRNLSAFAVLDGRDGALKRLERGGFAQQHAVRHLSDARFLMMDNQGAGNVSRLLMVDLAAGHETTIFPNERAPERLRNLFTRYRGSVDVSIDRRRAVVAYSDEGVAVEVRLSDGEVLAVFRSLHDVSDVERFGEERYDKAALSRLRGIYYAPTREEK